MSKAIISELSVVRLRKKPAKLFTLNDPLHAGGGQNFPCLPSYAHLSYHVLHTCRKEDAGVARNQLMLSLQLRIDIQPNTHTE